MKQPTATDVRSSEKFGAEMGEGWIEGLRSSDKVGIFHSATEVKTLRPRFYRQQIIRTLGDFDLLMGFTGLFSLDQILPDSGYIIRPESARLWQVPGIITEIKRSCDPNHMFIQKQVKNFVRYYKDALDPTKANRNMYSPV